MIELRRNKRIRPKSVGKDLYEEEKKKYAYLWLWTPRKVGNVVGFMMLAVFFWYLIRFLKSNSNESLLFRSKSECYEGLRRISGDRCSPIDNLNRRGLETIEKCQRKVTEVIERCSLESPRTNQCDKATLHLMCHTIDCQRDFLKQCIFFGTNGTLPESLSATPIHVHLRPHLKQPEIQGELVLEPLPYWIKSRFYPDIADITAAAHGSVSKLNQILRLATAWKGPLSVAIYTLDAERDKTQLEDFVFQHTEAFAKTDIHLLIGTVDRQRDEQDKNDDANAYPFNYMRNLALDAARTDFVLPVDADFISNPSAHQQLVDFIAQTKWNKLLRKKTVLVVPAFQRLFDPNISVASIYLPSTKRELVQELASDPSMFKPFHLPEYFKGHGPTDYDKWYQATEPYEVEYEYKYEPYVVAYRKELPRFWNQFRGFGWNKQSWLYELNAAGYKFYVLDEPFLIHIDHESEAERKRRVSRSQEQVKQFKAYIRRKYR